MRDQDLLLFAISIGFLIYGLFQGSIQKLHLAGIVWILAGVVVAWVPILRYWIDQADEVIRE